MEPDVRERFDVLEAVVRGLVTAAELNGRTLGQLATTVGDLSTTVGELSTTVGELSTTVGELAATVTRVVEQMESTNKRIDDLVAALLREHPNGNAG